MAGPLDLLLRIVLKRDGVDAGLKQTRQGAGETAGAFQQLKDAAKGLVTGLVGGIGVIYALKQSVGAAQDFGLKMAEVSTLLDDTSSLDALTKKTRELAKEFGTAPTEQAQALYNIISAGATDAAEATAVLTAANKLAQGGVTDVNTAAAGLVGVLNAYGLEADQAGRISDGLFATMRAGRTTIGELSTGLGQVTPIAAQAGVSFEEIAAATAAITTVTGNTSQAVTALRGVISAVIKPSGEAAELAEKLGLQFDVQALKAKGLSGFLADVAAKTGGSSEQQALLFGQVEALGAVMSLTGAQAGTFAETLDSVRNSTGETDKAVEKIAGSDAAAMQRFKSAIGDLAISTGNLVSKALVPLVSELGKLVNEFNVTSEGSKELGDSVESAASKIGPILETVAGTAQAMAGGIRAFFNVVQIVIRQILATVIDYVALTREALAKITFGELSRNLAAEGENLRQTAKEIRDGIAEDLGDIDKAGEAVKAGLARATDGLSALGREAESTTPKVKAVSDTVVVAAGTLDSLARSAEAAAAKLVGVQGVFTSLSANGVKSFSDIGTASQRASQDATEHAGTVSYTNTEMSEGYKALAAEADKSLNARIEKEKLAAQNHREQADQTIGGLNDVTSAAATNADEVSGFAQSVGAMYDAMYATLRGMSEQTAQLFTSLELGVPFQQGASASEQMRTRIDELGESIQRVQQYINTYATAGIGVLMETSKRNFLEAQRAFLSQQLALEQYIESFETGNAAANEFTIGVAGSVSKLEALIAQAEAAKGSLNLLDDASLSRLQAQIDGARQRLDALRDSASNTLASVTDDLDRLLGKEEEIEKRRQQSRLAAIQQQLEAARAEGDAQAIRDLEAALGVQQQIYDITLKRIAEEKKAKAELAKSVEGPDFKPTITMSPAVPFRQGVKNMQDMLDGVDAPPLTFDAGSVRGVAAAAQDSAEPRARAGGIAAPTQAGGVPLRTVQINLTFGERSASVFADARNADAAESILRDIARSASVSL